MAKRGLKSWNCEQLCVDEAPPGRFDPESGVNGLPSRSACWTAKGYAEASLPGQEKNRVLELLPAETI